MLNRNLARLIFAAILLSAFGCQKSIFEGPTVAPASLRDVAALRLNFRFESDVPAPPDTIGQNPQSEERNAAVQADFDQNRQQELLDKTILSPDKQRVLAIYHAPSDQPAEFRLDMYSPDGKLIKKITYNGMAVHFPDTIVWSPDSKSLAFVGMIRAGLPGGQPLPTPADNANANANTQAAPSPAPDANVNANTATEATPAEPAPQQPQGEQPQPVLTLGTEQIYICNSDGGDLKLVTQNQRLIYFYFVWSPDSSMLAALAATPNEWRLLEYQAREIRKEIFVPFGRLRLVEKTGRERLLDDNLTKVRPVWSPDSAKVAIAFETQIRVYDAIGNQPTQAAIPLENQLRISSKAYDEELLRKEQGGDANAAPAPVNANVSTLPDPSSLVSYSPFVELRWTEPEMLYAQTGYVRLFRNEAENVRSYMRWHRLVFSPQATPIK